MLIVVILSVLAWKSSHELNPYRSPVSNKKPLKIQVVDARANLPDAEVVKLFKTYYGNLQEAFEQAKSTNRTDAAEELKAELAIIQEFLPKAPSPEETKKLVQQAIAESGAQSKKDIGMVMKSLMKLNNTVDGKLAKELIDQLLS